MKSGQGIAIATAFIVSAIVFVVKVWVTIWILKLMGVLP